MSLIGVVRRQHIASRRTTMRPSQMVVPPDFHISSAQASMWKHEVEKEIKGDGPTRLQKFVHFLSSTLNRKNAGHALAIRAVVALPSQTRFAPFSAVVSSLAEPC